jgi:hypothetical protein
VNGDDSGQLNTVWIRGSAAIMGSTSISRFAAVTLWTMANTVRSGRTVAHCSGTG